MKIRGFLLLRVGSGLRLIMKIGFLLFCRAVSGLGLLTKMGIFFVGRVISIGKLKSLIALLKKLYDRNRNKLDTIRKLIFTNFKHIDRWNSQQIQDIYKTIFKEMRSYYVSLIKQALIK